MTKHNNHQNLFHAALPEGHDATVYQMWKGVVSINLEKEMIDKVPFFL